MTDEELQALLAQPGNQTQSMGAAAPSPAPAPGPMAGVANAGVSSVPNFQPPPGIADHAQSLAQRIAGAVGNVAHGVGNSISGLSPADRANMSPEQQSFAGKMALRNAGLAMLNRQPDARGFMPSTLQSIAQGIQAGQASGQQTLGTGEQQQQFGAGLAANQRLTAGRAQISALLAPVDGEDPQGDARVAKLVRAQGIAVASGDDKAATSLADMVRALRPYGKLGANGQPAAHFQVKSLGNRDVMFDPNSGKMTEMDGTPITDASMKETPFHAAENAARQATSDTNSVTAQQNLGTRRDTAWANTVEKPFTKQALAVGKWGAVYQQARGPNGGTGNEAASKAVLAAFLGGVDGNVQLRMSTFNTLSQTAPALMDRINRYRQGLSVGTIPQDQLDKMDQVIKATSAVNKTQYQNTVTTNLRHFPEQADRAKTWEQMTGEQAVPSAAPAAGKLDMSKF